MRTRRCLSLALSVALLTASAGESQVAPSRSVISSWPSTTHYIAFAEFEEARTGQIRITAGGSYTLYLNGDLVGADADAATVETWEVEFDRRGNEIAVVVDHAGDDTPFGLFAVLDSEEGPFVSSPLDRVTPWFWTGDALPNEEGADWLELRVNELPRHVEDGVAITWSPVQAGTLDPTAFAAFADLDLTRARSVAGYPGGLDGSRGSLQLRRLDGLNLAFGSLSEDPNLVDGDVSSSVTFSRGATALLDFIETDLGRLVTIAGVRVMTRPPRTGSYADNSLRGYSVLVSKDGVNFIEVATRNRIEDYRETTVAFPPISARHVRILVTEFSDRDSSPQVGEIEVYGVGVVPTGTFRSAALDLGVDGPKNLDRVIWHGDVPSQASLQLRFRAGTDGETWSDWTAWRSAAEIVPDVPEPASFLQFEARMETRTLTTGPRLDSLIVTFDDDNLPVEGAAASILPASVPMGADTTFRYTLDLTVGSGAGVERLALITPYPALVDIGAIEGLGGSVVDPTGTYATSDSLVLAFTPAITGDTQIVIPFQTRLLSANHDFASVLFAPGSSNPARTSVREGEDPDSGLPLVRVVEATTFDLPVLSESRAVPPVVTPNGDGINDQTTIEFVLGRVSEAQVQVEISDLSGRVLRVLGEGQVLGAGSYSGVGSTALRPGTWDGRDSQGDLVPPGTYLYRVVVDLEPDDVVALGLIAVAY